MQHLKAHRSRVHALAFSADGTKLASIGGKGKAISLRNIARENQRVFLSEHYHPVRQLAFSPVGSLLVSVDSIGDILYWDVRTKLANHVPPSIVEHFTRVGCFCFSPDGMKLVLLDFHYRSYSCRVLNLKASPVVSSETSQREICTVQMISPWEPKAIAYSGQQLAVAVRRFSTKNTTIDIWPSEGKTIDQKWEVQGNLYSLTFLSENLLAVAAGKEVTIWDVSTAARIARLRGHTRVVTGIAATSDGQHLFSASSDGLVKCWDVLSGKEVQALDWGIGGLNCLTLSGDGMRAAVGGLNGDIVMWDVDL